MRLHVSDLADERVWPVVSALDDELCHHHRVVCSPSKGPNPPLRRREVGRVEGEGLIFGIPSTGSLQATNIGTVAQFRLSITPDMFVVLGRLEEELLLLWSSLATESRLEDG